MDFRLLNEHEVHPLPKVDETLAQLAGAKVFSKLDANCGFWQIPLVSYLTTFITHMVDFASTNYNLVSQLHQAFQRKLSEILAGQEGVLCNVVDVEC